MPKVISGLNGSRFLIQVIVQEAKLEGAKVIFSPNEEKRMPILALIDTGATGSAISEEVAKELGLKEVAKNITQTAGGSKEFPFYNVVMQIPSDINPSLHPNDPNDLSKGSRIVLKPQAFVNHFVRIAGNEFIREQGIDAIIGMDVLSRAHVTITDGRLVMSF